MAFDDQPINLFVLSYIENKMFRSDQSLTIRSPERKFLTSITLALHLAQPHCASITKHAHHIWHHICSLLQQYAICIFQTCVLSSGVHIWVNAYYKFWTPKAKTNLLANKPNCYMQRQSTPTPEVKSSRTALLFDWFKRKKQTKDTISDNLSICYFFLLFET